LKGGGMKNYDGWAMKSFGHIMPWSCQVTRKDVVKWFESNNDLQKYPQFKWRNFRKRGTHKIVKVRIIEVKK